jgi:HNH endonuclease
MAIGNKLRYQVLRRDNYTCRYCGVYAPFARLVVDHVTPRKHGGRDVMENLVTACDPCNSGKSAAMPESWLVAEVEEAAREWHGIAPTEPDEDDLREMETYQESLYLLEALPANEALHWIAQAYIAVFPYRPSHEELINGAAGIARCRSAEWRENMNADF